MSKGCLFRPDLGEVLAFNFKNSPGNTLGIRGIPKNTQLLSILTIDNWVVSILGNPFGIPKKSLYNQYLAKHRRCIGCTVFSAT